MCARMIRRVSAKASALLRACSQHGFFAAGDGELRAPLCVAFRSLFVAAGIFFQLFASAFFASCCFCAFFVNWGRVVLRVCSLILFGWEKHGMQVSSGVRGNVAGQLCAWFFSAE